MFKSILFLSALAQAAWAAPVAEPIDSGLVRRATPVNYNQNYIAGGANVQYSPNLNAGTFTVNWNTNADFVVGLGWTKGDTTPVTYSGSFSVKSGTPGGLLSLYGWTTSPLVEYYIVENPGNGYSTGGTHKGTVISDGATYDIWLHQQVNQPSIQGTSTFNQYISIRQTPRNSGTITLQNHFSAWAALGMQLGAFNYQTISVESWSGSGSASLAVSKGTSAGSATPPTTTTTTKAASPTTTTAPPASSAPSGGSGTVTHWGQCGGQGYSGPTTCAAPYTCKASNAYYSQCL